MAKQNVEMTAKGQPMDNFGTNKKRAASVSAARFLWQSVCQKQSGAAEGQSINKIVQAIAYAGRIGDQDGQVNKQHQEKDHDAQICCCQAYFGRWWERMEAD